MSYLDAAHKSTAVIEERRVKDTSSDTSKGHAIDSDRTSRVLLERLTGWLSYDCLGADVPADHEQGTRAHNGAREKSSHSRVGARAAHEHTRCGLGIGAVNVEAREADQPVAAGVDVEGPCSV